MTTIKRTESFDLAYRFVTETNQNIFLTGKAGTGKTTFLKYLREHTCKNTLVAAPTGVAAINAGGVTLHSLFQLPFAPFIPSFQRSDADTLNSHSLLSHIRYNKNKINLLRNLELLIIDETSMLASHTVDAIDTILKRVRRRQHLPFGGVQILFIGDLYQLPPVVKQQEWDILSNYYDSIFFFDSKVLKDNVPVMIELKEIFRQQDNLFIELLNEIRNNQLTESKYYLLQERLKRHFAPDEKEGYIMLTTHNYQADEINRIKLNRLSVRTYTYSAEIHGDFPKHLYPAEPELELKKGAQVMFLKNDVEGKQYFNGKIGVITYLDEETIKVRCKDEQHDIKVVQHEWKNINYTLNPDTHQIEEEELGVFYQYPLRLAWAITIHKSQGLTFDKLIIDAENAFANGQVYVALSRCTSLEGLVLTTPVNRQYLGAPRSLKEWQRKNQDEKTLPERFYEARQQYVLQELLSVFTWKGWYYELTELNELIFENKESLPSECLGWIKKLTEELKAIENIAVKFKQRIVEMSKLQANIENNPALQKRLQDASGYFVTEISKWKELFCNHPLSANTKKLSKKTDASLNEIAFTVHAILQNINNCKNGFYLYKHLQNKKKKVTTNPVQTTYTKKQGKKNTDAKKHALA